MKDKPPSLTHVAVHTAVGHKLVLVVCMTLHLKKLEFFTAVVLFADEWYTRICKRIIEFRFDYI